MLVAATLCSILAAVCAQEEKADGEMIRGFIRGLAADFLEDRLAARKGLEAAGKEAEPFLIEGLGSGDYRTRRICLELLGAMKSASAVQKAGEVFRDDEESTVRVAAFEFLTSMGEAAEAPLIAALESRREEIRILAIGALRGIESERALARIAELIREDESRKIRKEAFEYLTSMGIKAEKELIGVLSNEGRDVRREAIETLGREQSEASIPRLLQFVGGTDKTLKQSALDALARIGSKAIEATVAEVKAGRMTQRTADSILALYYRLGVERILAGMASERGTIAYAGLLRELQDLGIDKTRPVLLEIARNESYPFRESKTWKAPRIYACTFMRENAVLSLGELGDVTAVEPLKEILAGRPKWAGAFWACTFHKALAMALYRLGEKKPFDALEKMMVKNAERVLKEGPLFDGCQKLIALAVIQKRVGRRAESRETCHRILELGKKLNPKTSRPVFHKTYYILAVLDGLAGKKTGAIEWLEKSIRAGYPGRHWFRMDVDVDLDAIREEPGFLKLLADEEPFKDRIPK